MVLTDEQRELIKKTIKTNVKKGKKHKIEKDDGFVL